MLGLNTRSERQIHFREAGTTPLSGSQQPSNLYSSLADCDNNANVLFTNTKTVSGNGDYTSANFTPTSVGTYYWLASYSGDETHDGTTSACGKENFTATVDNG